MRRRRDLGVCMLYARNESCYALDPDDYPKIKQAWMKGEAFVTARSFQGAEIVVKLGTIEAIQLHTADSIALQAEEDAADKRDDSITGVE